MADRRYDGRDDNPFMVSAYQDFKDRLKQLRVLVESVTRASDDKSVETELCRREDAERLFESMVSES